MQTLQEWKKHQNLGHYLALVERAETKPIIGHDEASGEYIYSKCPALENQWVEYMAASPEERREMMKAA